jgi:hypothetical protein
MKIPRVWIVQPRRSKPVVRDAPDTRGALANVRDALFALMAYVVFASFVYVRLLYSHFGIPVNQLEVPFNELPFYAYNVLASVSFLVVAAGLLVLLGLVWGMARLAIRPALYTCALLMFPILYHAASIVATETAVAMRTGRYVKTITLVLEPDALSSYPEEFVQANAEEGLTLIVETPHSFFVLAQPEASDGELPMAALYEVPREKVRMAVLSLANVAVRRTQ